MRDGVWLHSSVMKLLLFLAILLGGYYYMLKYTTDVVLHQMQYLQNQYTYIANHADHIATGQ